MCRTLSARLEPIRSVWRNFSTHLHTLHDADELTLGVIEIRSVRNALRETIRELGVEEFHTRTGYDFEQGEALLQKLTRILGE